MIARLESGFEVEINEKALNDMEFLDAVRGVQDNDVFALSCMVEKMLDAKSKKQLYDHLRTGDGRVPMDAVCRAVSELLLSFGAGKNSSSSPN
ncbi:MAG: hypothetical protein ACI4JC_03835 [Faecalibacterium sp.]